MCEPATIALAVSLAGTAVAAKSSIDQGKYQNQVAQNNAKVQEYAAKDAMDRGAVEEQQQRNKVRQLQGAQRAALAANGINSTTGTGSQLLMDSAAAGEFDALAIRNNAMKSAWGLNTQAGFTRADGAAAKKAGTNNAIGTLLTGGSQAYGMGQKAGYWGKTPANATKAG